jgi:hypothetical protein
MELRDFLDKLGTVMRLPKRKKKSTEPEGGGRKIPWRPILLGLTAVGMVAMMVHATRNVAKTNTTVPAEFVGTWRTDHHKYANRTFRIDVDQVAIQTGPRQSELKQFPVQSADVRQAHDTTYLTIAYLDGQRPVEWALQMDPGSQSVVRLSHQPEIAWVRVSHSARSGR